MRHKKAPEGENARSFRALVARLKASPDSIQKGRLIMALENLMDIRLAVLVKKCGDKNTLSKVCAEAFRKHTAGEKLNELEQEVLVVAAADRLLRELKIGVLGN